MQRVHATLTGTDGRERWTVTAPGVGQVTIDDPRLADLYARQLLQRHLDLDWSEAEDFDVVLVGEDGEARYVFDLLFTSALGDERGHPDQSRHAELAANPPHGCRFVNDGSYPRLRCVRRGTSLFDAVGTLVAQIRDRYGLDADDLGFEKLWEWAGTREWRERMIAQLLLMATHRARLTGVPAEDLIALIRSSMARDHRPASGDSRRSDV